MSSSTVISTCVRAMSIKYRLRSRDCSSHVACTRCACQCKCRGACRATFPCDLCSHLHTRTYTNVYTHVYTPFYTHVYTHVSMRMSIRVPMRVPVHMSSHTSAAYPCAFPYTSMHVQRKVPCTCLRTCPCSNSARRCGRGRLTSKTLPKRRIRIESTRMAMHPFWCMPVRRGWWPEGRLRRRVLCLNARRNEFGVMP